MFGNKAKISAEELAYMKEQLDNDRGFFENVNAKSKLIEADFDELEKSRQLEESSLKQLNDNANNVVEFSKDSMDAISALNDSFTECVKAAADNLTSLESAAKAIATQHEDTCALVENNKHFTAPAKSLSETSDRLEEHVDSCAEIAAQMKEQNKQMSVLSLNAAIEAGMLGEQGKLFVEAAESIREASVSYDSAIDAVKQELSEAKAEISALKEQVSHLVGLLKDNNVATTKLMKQGVELNHVFSQCDEISVDMIEACRQQIVSIRNTQEEIIKFEERNKLQIEDAYAEISTQRKNSAEIKSTVDKVLDYSRERVR